MRPPIQYHSAVRSAPRRAGMMCGRGGPPAAAARAAPEGGGRARSIGAGGDGLAGEGVAVAWSVRFVGVVGAGESKAGSAAVWPAKKK